MSTKNMFRLGLCQFKTVASKATNLSVAEKFVKDAASRGANVIALPEFFNCPMAKEFFNDFKEDLKDKSNRPSYDLLSGLAKDTKTLIVGGSIPETDDSGRVYNTSLVFDKNGELVAKHRKIHMFDIDIPGQKFRESDFIHPGDQITVFDSEYCKMGLGICYDIRFPEQALLMAEQGAKVLFYPAAFNATTGPLHFELLGRARALDCQTYVAMIGQARNFLDTKGYQCWGHSVVISPNGLVAAQADLRDTLLMTDVDLEDVEKQREGFQYSTQKRNDIYGLVHKNKLIRGYSSRLERGGIKVGYPDFQKDIMQSMGIKSIPSGEGVKVGYTWFQPSKMNIHSHKGPKIGYPGFQKDVISKLGQGITSDGDTINIGYTWFQTSKVSSESKSVQVGYPIFQEDYLRENNGVTNVPRGQDIKIGYTWFQPSKPSSESIIPQVGYTNFQEDYLREYKGLTKIPRGEKIKIGYPWFQLSKNQF